MKKRILSLILALAMILSLVVPAYAETTGQTQPNGMSEGSTEHYFWVNQEEWDVRPGESVTLEVYSEEDPSAFYFSWYRYDNAASDYEVISGVTGTSCEVQYDDVGSGDYRCNVTDGADYSYDLYFRVNRQDNGFYIWTDNNYYYITSPAVKPLTCTSTPRDMTFPT